MIKRIELNIKTSIEREIFPVMAKEGNIFAFDLHGFWKDLGKPADFILGLAEFLEFMQGKDDKVLAVGE